MTVICQHCKKVIREKCPTCGETGSDVSDYETDEFWCDHCISYFSRGEGGTSHGICEDCFRKTGSGNE